jgi:hypothetical protein
MLQGNIDIMFRVKGHKGACSANLACGRPPSIDMKADISQICTDVMASSHTLGATQFPFC